MTPMGEPVPLIKGERQAERRAVGLPFAGMFVWDIPAKVGESPVWEPEAERLIWIDVRGQTLFRLDPQSKMLESWSLPEVVGAVGILDRYNVIVAMRRQLAVVDLVRNTLCRWDEVASEPQFNRLNEGKFSPSRKWFVFGSMDDRPNDKQQTGGLYRADSKGQIALLHRGLTIANGLAWSNDGLTIFFSDSFAGTIFHARWSEEDGTMSPPAVFAQSDETQGRPDGALIDKQGCYLSAGVSAGRLNKFNMQGALVDQVPLPMQFPTMPCAAGMSSRMFVTSLVRPGQVAQPCDGLLLDIA